eukprot:4610897-Heterocapsa_arctica.AAC.1
MAPVPARIGAKTRFGLSQPGQTRKTMFSSCCAAKAHRRRLIHMSCTTVLRLRQSHLGRGVQIAGTGAL